MKYKLFYRYEELTESQKAQARKLRPYDYKEWQYCLSGVNIEFAAK